VLILAVLLAGWLLLKTIDRRRFFHLLERSRISPQTLKERLDRGENLVVVDLRSDLAYRLEGLKVRGAIHIPPGEFKLRYREIPEGRPVVMYCTCPNEATSARMALLLMSKGYNEVWPLRGGLDAWRDLGYPTETYRAEEGPPTTVSAASPSVSV
jgi:rhodanese-related sulfurtransferase